MGVGSPLHSKTSKLCQSLMWKEWAGYFAVQSYDTCHIPEYFAIRHAAGLMDASPLYKYEIKGKDAKRFLNYVLTRSMKSLKVNQVSYCCWCDEDGKILDDGTVTCFSPNHYRITSANPSLNWFTRNSLGMEVEIEDSSQQLAALALQGPNSRSILKQICDADMDNLKYFWSLQTKLDGKIDATISRTGYTGDLGYEVFIEADKAEDTWDLLMKVGQDYGLLPTGLLALDMTRVEAGYVLIDVDFYSARHAMIEAQKSTPYELGFDWMVHLKKDIFIGHEALRCEKEQGPQYQLVALEIDWEELETAYESIGLPPHLPVQAWRKTVPIYTQKKHQVGRATSGTWSPILKKNIALATVETKYATLGTQLKIEVMVEYEQKLITARVVNRPFFDPPRKRG